MNKLNPLKIALAAAVKENTVANETGTATWDDALKFAYTAMPVAESLMQCAEFLADALPGIEAYATSLGNENYRSMWLNQIAKYKQALEVLGLSPAPIDLKDWAQIEEGWYVQIIGDKEVHLTPDADLGHEVSVKREGLNIKNPNYYPEFEMAYWAAEKEVRALLAEQRTNKPKG